MAEDEEVRQQESTYSEFTAPAKSDVATFATNPKTPGVAYLFGVSINHFTKYTREELIAEGYDDRQLKESAEVLAACDPPQQIGCNAEAHKAWQQEAMKKYEAALNAGK